MIFVIKDFFYTTHRATSGTIKTESDVIKYKTDYKQTNKEIHFGICHKYIPFVSGCRSFGGFDIEIDDNTTYKAIKDECKKQIQTAIKNKNSGLGEWLSECKNFIKEKKLDVNKIETFEKLYDLVNSDPSGYQKEKILSKKDPVTQTQKLYNSLINLEKNPDKFKISSVSINNSIFEFKTPTKLNIQLHDNDKIKEKLKIDENTKSVYLIINN